MKGDVSQAPLLLHLSVSVAGEEGEEELVSSLSSWLLCLSDSLPPPTALSLGLLPSPEKPPSWKLQFFVATPPGVPFPCSPRTGASCRKGSPRASFPLSLALARPGCPDPSLWGGSCRYPEDSCGDLASCRRTRICFSFSFALVAHLARGPALHGLPQLGASPGGR